MIRFNYKEISSVNRDIEFEDIPFSTVETKARYREDGGNDWVETKGIAMNVPDTNRVVHTVEIEGLEQDKRYEFQLSTGTQVVYLTWKDNPCTSIVIHWHTTKPLKESYTNGFANEIRKFKTLPETLNNSIKFAQTSDTHGGGLEKQIYEQIANIGDVRGIIHSGDMATGNGGEVRPLTWYTFFNGLQNAVNSDGTIIPIIPALGNHEIWRGHAGTQWSPEFGKKPNFETGKRGDAEWYYCFFPSFLEQGYAKHTFGDYLTVWQLDPGITTRLDEGQDTWLSTTMSDDNSAHKIVSLHYSPYSAVRDPSLNYITDVREKIPPIVENYKTLVLTGHDHILKKTVPIKNGQEDEDGVVYIGSGPSGTSHTHSAFDPTKTWWLDDVIATGYRDSAREGFDVDNVVHFWLIDINYSSRSVSAIDLTGKQAMSFEQFID